MKALPLLHVGDQRAHAVVGALEPELRQHARQHHRVVDGLGHVVVGAGAERADDVVARVVRRAHDDGQQRGVARLAHLLQHLDAAHAGHHDVEQDQLARVRLEPRERLEPVLRHVHRETGALEAAREHVTIVFVIVYHQDDAGVFGTGRHVRWP
jgi:hypothetical protein